MIKLTEGQSAQIKSMKKDNTDLQIRKFFKDTYQIKLSVSDIRNACKDESIDMDDTPKIERRKYTRRQAKPESVRSGDRREEILALLRSAYKLHQSSFMELIQQVVENK